MRRHRLAPTILALLGAMWVCVGIQYVNCLPGTAALCAFVAIAHVTIALFLEHRGME